MTKYNLTSAQIHGLANLCKQEQGTIAGAKAEACLIANILEEQAYYRNKYGTDIYNFARNSGWFSRAAYWMDHGSASTYYDDAIKDVLCNGNRTLPVFVDEHDAFSDITSATNNGRAISIRDRSAYIQDVTLIKNRYGSKYTFWCFPTATSDPFGYTNTALRNRTVIEPDVKTLLAKATSYLGVAEPTGDDQFIKYYNNITGAGFSLNVAWCAIFVSVIARMCSVSTDVVPTFADCDAGVRWYKSKNRYELSKAYGGSYIPLSGDIVFYSSGYTQSDSTHVGYVVECNGSSLTAIEGNKNDKVDYRKIDIGSKYIIGYGRVSQYLNTNMSDDNRNFIIGLYKDLLNRTPSESEIDSWLDVMASGASRESVKQDFINSEEYKKLHPSTDIFVESTKTFQQWLISYTGTSLSIDGKCGPSTKQVAVCAMQQFLNKEYYAGLAVDGKFGSKTRKAFRTIKQGTRGINVYIVQGLLYGHGVDPAGFDGSCGNGCVSAIKHYQETHGLAVDGKCGPDTFASMIS